MLRPKATLKMHNHHMLTEDAPLTASTLQLILVTCFQGHCIVCWPVGLYCVLACQFDDLQPYGLKSQSSAHLSCSFPAEYLIL